MVVASFSLPANYCLPIFLLASLNPSLQPLLNFKMDIFCVFVVVRATKSGIQISAPQWFIKVYQQYVLLGLLNKFEKQRGFLSIKESVTLGLPLVSYRYRFQEPLTVSWPHCEDNDIHMGTSSSELHMVTQTMHTYQEETC